MARDPNAYCAFCRSPRRIYRHRGIQFFHVLASGLTAFIGTLVVFQELDPRGIFLFVLSLAGAEIFLRLRWRIHIVCKQCGFDPVLYLKQPDQALIKVKAFLAYRKDAAEFLLSPALNLPTVTEKANPQKGLIPQESKSGSYLSQRV